MKIASISPMHCDYHVVPNPRGGWILSQERSQFRQYAMTQIEAIGYGVELARTDAVSLIIHGADGRFREVYNYALKGLAG